MMHKLINLNAWKAMKAQGAILS